MKNIQPVKGAKFNEACMEGQIVAKELQRSMVWSAHVLQKYKLQAAEGALRKCMAECESAAGKLVVPSGRSEQNKMLATGKRFRFFVPRRMAEFAESSEKLAQVNAVAYMGMFVGLRNKSLSIAMVPVETNDP